MCRMIAAPQGVPGRLLIDPFVRMAQGQNSTNEINTSLGLWTHLESWGAVYEQDGRLVARHGVRSCDGDPDLEELREARVFLLHARKASSGAVCRENTHPFSHVLGHDEWFFSHNGTVRDPLPAPPTLHKEGSTDTERVFHSLLPYVAEGDPFRGFASIYSRFNDYTCLNSFLLGPDTFWAVCLHTENPRYYTLVLAEHSEGPILSSEPLADLSEEWSPMTNQRVLCFDRSTGEKAELDLAL